MADEVVKNQEDTKIPVVEGKIPDTKVENNIEEGENKEEVVLTEEQKEEERLKQEDKTKKQSRLDKRFKDLTTKVKVAESTVNSWRETLQELAGEAPPVKSEFKTTEEYQAAVEEYREKIRGPKAQFDQAIRETNKAETELNKALYESWDEKMDTIADEIPDYEAVVKRAKVPLAPATLKAILSSNVGPQIVYFLAKNQETAHDLNELTSEQQILEIGRLESKVQGGRKVVPTKTENKKDPPNPPPGQTVPKGERAPSKKDPGQMNLEEYSAWRKTNKG